MLKRDIFKAYDIRGIYPTDIDKENIAQITKAILSFFQTKLNKENPTIVLGRDMRLSSPTLSNVVQKTLLEYGADVIDIGLVSTPTFYFAVYHYNYDAGIQITASHNPKEYNGIKFVLNSPDGIIKIGKTTGMDEIFRLASSDLSSMPKKPGRLTQKENVLHDEVSSALAYLGKPEIKKIKIVADSANAMGATYLNEIFKMLSIDPVRMNFELDGNFPSHPPDPLDFDNLKDLCQKVTEENADLGLAPDGDGDRMFFIDEKGEVVPASVITAMIAREMVTKNPGSTFLFDIRYTITAKKAIEDAGGVGKVSRVGHAFITEGMAKENALFAGESSGHYFYKETGNAESQVITVLIVLSILSKADVPFSELVERYRDSFESGEINFQVVNAPEILARIKEKYSSEGPTVNEMDGLSLEFPNWRLSLRTSNTEPLLRLNLEAKDKQTMEVRKKELVGYIEEVGRKE